jgi:hypothetical protein
MRTVEELELRAAVQIALLGMISSDIRAISFDFVQAQGLLRFRVHFSGSPHEIALENMSSVLTEVDAGITFLSRIEEEYLIAPLPTKPECLSKVIYMRCESPDFLPPA